jgi:hypothetical protein
MSKLIVPPNFIGSAISDTIQATTTAFNDIGIQVDFNGVIDTREGNDTVSGTATGDTSYGINDDGYIALGSGNDSIKGTASFAGIQVSLEGILDGESGNDIIIGSSNSTGFTHNAYGIIISGGYLTGGSGDDFGGYLSGGSGDDFIKGEARGIVPGNVSGGILVGGILDGGNGNDIITGIGINENGLGFGIRTYDNGSVRGGNGNDIITGYGTTTGYGSTFGIEEGIGTIDGGNGEDYFKARLIDSQYKELSNQGGAIGNVLILGGRGKDTFDVGYGNATLDGGQGFDTLILLGSADNYSIQGSNGDLTIARDGYALNTLNIENIVFVSDPLRS